METTSGYEDVYREVGIPTVITWSYDGKEVAVEGSWDNWKTRFRYVSINLHWPLWLFLRFLYSFFIRMPLQRSGKDFALMRYFRLVFTSTDLLWMDARSTLQIRLGPKMMLGMLTTSWTYRYFFISINLFCTQTKLIYDDHYIHFNMMNFFVFGKRIMLMLGIINLTYGKTCAKKWIQCD